MDLGSIFLILALFIVVVMFVSRPFFGTKKPAQSFIVDEEEHQISTLLAERDRVLDSLQELDLDYAIGKIPKKEYVVQRKVLLDRGAHILRELDAYYASTGQAGDQSEKDFDARLEAAIAERRSELKLSENTQQNSTAIKTAIADPDDDLEILIADRRRKRNDKAAGFCPKCGRPVQKSDRYCPKCGTTLSL